MALKLAPWALSPSNPPHDLGIWVPAFAGMSGSQENWTTWDGRRHSSPMTDLHRFQSFDGVSIGYRTLGDPAGWPTVMLHGFLASAESNWFLPGIAAAVAATGRRVIAPDLRGHGRSDAPSDPAAWPPDVLARDQEALVAHLHLKDYDLVGYSRKQIINDIISQYERHLQFLHLSR